MDIKVLGTGCTNCKNTIALIDQVAKAKGVTVKLEKVEELRDIMGYGVMSTRRGDRRQGGARRWRAQPRQDRTVADRLRKPAAAPGWRGEQRPAGPPRPENRGSPMPSESTDARRQRDPGKPKMHFT